MAKRETPPRMDVLFFDVSPSNQRTISRFAPDQHLPSAERFLLWQPQGPGAPTILAVARRCAEYQSHEVIAFVIAAHYCIPLDEVKQRLVGAGMIGLAHNVDWKSQGLELETPVEFQRPILQAVGIKQHAHK